MAFVEDRRDPTDRRSWRRAPVFVGDVAAHVDRPQWLMVVTGILPRRHVEVVTWTRVRDALGTVRDLDDVDPFAVEQEDDTFGTGFLSGADAAATLRGDGAGSAANATPEQVDDALNDVFPGAPDTVRRDDPFRFGR